MTLLLPDLLPVPVCPDCSATHVVRNGPNSVGTPTFRCRACGRRFVRAPRKAPVADDEKDRVRRLMVERLSLRAIARVTGRSRSWLQAFVNTVYREETPREPGPLKKKAGQLVVEADELWSDVGNKRAQWWIWVALDAHTRQVVGMVAGDRSERTAQCLWDALPDEYRNGAVVCTDFLAADRAVVPEDRHAAAGKDAGWTAHIERFWCTVRQRCGRFVRRTLSFSKCAENHVGALWYFIRSYNACRA